MGKKTMMVKCQIIFALTIMLLFSFNSYAQEFNKMKFSFQSKSQIIEWGAKEMGFYSNSDSTSFKIEGNDIFLLFGNYGSGIKRTAIFVFFRANYWKKREWRLICLKDTNTSKVSAELDQKRNEIVFKSKSGKILLILPFETLNVDFDYSEQ